MARAVKYERIAYARTVCLLGDPIGCGGVTPFEDGSAETWALFSPLIKVFPKAMFRACRDGIEAALKEFQPERLFACIDPNDLVAQRFMERLGYKMEFFLYTMEGRR